MEHLGESSSSNFVLQSTWNKLERDSTKIGYREGITDGRQKVYQNSFDIGYEGGFKNGFVLGQYKAIARVKELEGTTVETHKSLKETRKGICVVCKNNDLLETSIHEISNTQTEKMNILVKELSGK